MVVFDQEKLQAIVPVWSSYEEAEETMRMLGCGNILIAAGLNYLAEHDKKGQTEEQIYKSIMDSQDGTDVVSPHDIITGRANELYCRNTGYMLDLDCYPDVKMNTDDASVERKSKEAESIRGGGGSDNDSDDAKKLPPAPIVSESKKRNSDCTGIGSDEEEPTKRRSIGKKVQVNTKEDLEEIFKENEYNLFKVLLGGYDIDLSLLNDLEDWSRRRILLSMGLDETGLNGTEDLETIAKDLDEFFIKTEAKGLDLKFFRILLILHFPPSGQDLHVNGLMDTDGTNGPPVNPTLEEIYMLATLVLVERFGVSSQVALIIAMNTIVPTDVIPITLPHDAATKPPELADDADEDDVTPEYLAQVAAHEKYKKARDKSIEASVKHIDKLAQEYPFTYAIVSGSYPWDVYNKRLKGLASFKNIKVLQEFALIHPSALLDSLKNSKRQAFELVFYLSATFSALAEKPVCDITLDGPQRLLNRYIKKRGAGKTEFFYGAWYKGELVLLEHGAEELMSRIKKEVSSLQSSQAYLTRSWGSTTSSVFPNQEDLVARLSRETNQEKTISYYHLDIGVFLWKDCLKYELPEGSLRDHGLPPRGGRNTYQNITMGVQNNAVLGNWGAYVERNAPVQGARNSQLVARTSAPLSDAADGTGAQDVVDGFDDF